MPIRPIGTLILCKEIEDEGQMMTSSGLLLPNSPPKDTKKVIVVAIGNLENPHRIEELQTLVIRRYAGIPIEDDKGFKYLLIDEKEVLAEVSQ